MKLIQQNGARFALLVLLAGCSGSGNGAPPHVAIAPTSTPTLGPTSTSHTAGAAFIVRVPIRNAGPSARGRSPKYVSSGTSSITVALQSVDGTAPAQPISAAVAIATCPIVSSAYVCTLDVPALPGSDAFLISAFGGSPSVLISQQSVTETVVPGPNDFSGAPVTLDANPQTLRVSLGTPTTGVTLANGTYLLHGSESRAFPITLTDAAGSTISGGGSPTITAASADSAFAASVSGSNLVISPTGLSQSYASPPTAHTITLTIAPANAATDGLSSATSTVSAAVNYQLIAVPNANTTASVSQVNLYTYACPTPTTCAFVPVNQVAPGDGHGVLAESATTVPYAAQFDGNNGLVVCTNVNGSGPVQYFTNSALVGTPAAVGAASATFTAGINKLKTCDVAPLTQTTFAVVDGSGYAATPANIETEYQLATSTSTWQLGYAPGGTASTNVPVDVKILAQPGTMVSGPAPVAIALEAPANVACPAGAPCGEIAIVSEQAAASPLCNTGAGVTVDCATSTIGPLYNNSGAFLTAWDSANSRLIVACGTPDAGGNYELNAYPISGTTPGAATTIANLPSRPARLAVSTTGEIAVAYGTTTDEIDTYSAANAEIGTISGLTTAPRGMAFFDDSTLIVTAQTTTNSGTIAAYGINSATPLATTTLSSSAPTVPSVSPVI